MFFPLRSSLALSSSSTARSRLSSLLWSPPRPPPSSSSSSNLHSPPRRTLIDNITHSPRSGIEEFERVEQQYEKNFVNQYEKEVMGKLLGQMSEFVTMANEESIGELAKILTRYGVEAPEGLKKELIGWKQTLERKKW